MISELKNAFEDILPQELSGEACRGYARCLAKLGRYLLQTGESLARVESIERRAIQIILSLPLSEQIGYPFAASSLAEVLLIQEEFPEVEALLLDVMRWRLQAYGWTHPRFAATFYDLGRLYRKRGQLPAAKKAIRKAVRMFRTEGYTRNTEFATMLCREGDLCRHSGELEEARSLFSEALEILQNVRPPGDRRIVSVENRLASVTTRG